MEFSLSTENLLFFFVVANAILLFVLLMLAGRQSPAKRWLGWFVLALGLHLLGFRLVNTLYYARETFTLFSFSLVFAFGPLIYYYVLSLRGRPLTRRHALLLLPLVLDIGYQLGKAGYIYGFDLANRHVYYDNLGRPGVQAEFLLHDGLAILFTSWLIYRSYRSAGARFPYRSSRPELRTVSEFLLLYGVLQLVWIGYHLAEIWVFPAVIAFSNYLPLHAALAGLILYLGFRGLLQRPIPLAEKDQPKYATSALAGRELTAIGRKLIAYIETERPYLNPTLQLKALSTESGIPERQISQVLSTELDTNFYALMNRYRVERFIRILEDTAYQHLTLEGMAYEAGFNSKPTFYRAFRNETGLSPSAYRAQKRPGQPGLPAENPSHSPEGDTG